MTTRKIFQGVLDLFRLENFVVSQPTPDHTERIALDSCGCIGSIYDGITDTIKGKVKFDFQPVIRKLKKQMKCRIRKEDFNKDNLLQSVDFDHQLRVSVLLNMIPASGIAFLIEYPLIIHEHTRFFYIYHESRQISCPNGLHQLVKPVVKSASESCSTHIITEVIYGVHLLVILRLNPKTGKNIDILLSNMQQSLSSNERLPAITSFHTMCFDQIISTSVYSNIQQFSKMTKFENVYRKLIDLQKNDEAYRPLKYVLTPIRWFYGQQAAGIPRLFSCNPNETEYLEHYIIQQTSEYKQLNTCIQHSLPDLLQGKLPEQLNDIQTEMQILNVLRGNDIAKHRDLFRNIRRGNQSYKTIAESILDPPKHIELKMKYIKTLIKELETKGKLLKQLEKNGFEYCNVVEFGISANSKEDIVKDLLLGNEQHRVIFLSDDTFQKQDTERWAIIYSQLIDEYQKNPRLQLVYADFSYSTFKLKKMQIARLPHNNTVAARPSLNSIQTQRPVSPLAPIDDCINILLLGESGVGKSTFINAFANYLRFRSLAEAEKGQPIVIIPVSYIMTINDDFEERIVRFGEPDFNENHNDGGQSVTQQCHSYLFNITNEKKLRFIDTPGFGDTRGNEQDDLNMEIIFSYLNNFPCVHGVCLLFKPEVSQLNPYFRSCCTQLFDYFGENIRDHLMFCFTNTRSTFFAPGNTRPLLNQFFASFPVKNIPFGRENTFSFDSESFRYLIALQNDIQFDGTQRDEFERSWHGSVTESQRFRDYLIKQRPYRRNVEWQSLKDIQFQIGYLIRPLLETVRNLLRNVIISKHNASIRLCATHVAPGSTTCYLCNRQNIQKIDDFWILPDYLHHSSNTDCTSDEQKLTEYRVKYVYVSNEMDMSSEDLSKQLKCLYEICAKLFYFARMNFLIDQEDPFLAGIDRMLKEEEFILRNQNSATGNNFLIEGLNQFKEKYQVQINALRAQRESLTVSDIYDLIKSVNEISMVKTQVNAIKDFQKILVARSQRDVTTTKTN